MMWCTVTEGSPARDETPAPSFRRYAVEKTAFAVLVLWLAVSFVFLLFYVLPADPARQVAGKGAEQAQVDGVRHALHLDRSPVVRAALSEEWRRT
jgi:ABC-type dipeptide/oligopeptide/nickel transport system permease component